MARRGRSNTVPDVDQIRVIDMAIEKDMDAGWLWTIREIAEETELDPKTVRGIMRDWLRRQRKEIESLKKPKK